MKLCDIDLLIKLRLMEKELERKAKRFEVAKKVIIAQSNKVNIK